MERVQKVKKDSKLHEAEKKALLSCLFEKKLELLLSVQVKRNQVNKRLKRMLRIQEMEKCGQPAQNPRLAHPIDTVQKQQVRQYVAMIKRFTTSNVKHTKMESLSEIIDFFCTNRQNSTRAGSRIADNMLQLARRQLEIIKIDECHMKNMKNLSKRIESLLYRVMANFYIK